MKHPHCKAALLLCLMSCAAHAQSAAAPAAATTLPAYDVTTVKSHKGNGNISVTGRPGMYEALNVALQNLIADAYGVPTVLVYGLPAWAESGRYDIEAKVSEPDLAVLKKLTSEQRRAMLAGILKDRFGVMVHTETKTIAIYELALTPDGPKFKPSAALPAEIANDPNKAAGVALVRPHRRVHRHAHIHVWVG